MLKVLIEPAQAVITAIDTRKGTTNGYDWAIRSQHCWIFQPASQFPELYVINLPDDVQFYAAGDYMLNVDSMIAPDKYKAISLSRRGVVLTPVAAFSNSDDSVIKKTIPPLKYGV